MNREQTEQLLSRYLDGETTNEEEQQLRQYFAARQIVPPEWEAYKALFGWEDSQRPSAADGGAASAPIAKKHRAAIAACIAALIAVGAGIAATWLATPRSGLPGAGNYAVLDGRYTADEAVIAHEAEAALLMVSASEEDTFYAIDILTTQ